MKYAIQHVIQWARGKLFAAAQSLFLALSLALFFALPLVALTPAAAQEFVEGAHYELLSETQPVQTGDKIEVVELFWYKCPHCYRLEPYMTRWLNSKPENAELVPVPAVLGQDWAFEARIYYTLQALGLSRELHADVFHALHQTRRPLNTVDRLANWAAKHGVDRQTLTAAAQSFAVENKIQFATVMTRKYGITGVPAIIVDGKYRTSVALAGGQEKLLEVINFLVGLAAEQRG